jgi:hypothetical protein
MIACFVDIGGIVDHNYLNFPFKKTLKNLWEYFWGFPEKNNC